MTQTRPQVTQLLQELGRGSRDAEAALIPLIYVELRRIARNLMRGERREHTLQTTALVHEAYMRLAQPQPGGWKDRSHFFSAAARVMRQVLVDHARARQSEKRGGELRRVDLLEPSISPDDPELILWVDDAVKRLSEFDPRQGRIVELRFFAGMTVSEIAEAMQLSERTVKREWQLARAWLYGKLAP